MIKTGHRREQSPLFSFHLGPTKHRFAPASAAAPADPAGGRHGCWATALATAAARRRSRAVA